MKELAESKERSSYLETKLANIEDYHSLEMSRQRLRSASSRGSLERLQAPCSKRRRLRSLKLQATQTDICHPTVHYFVKVFANTLLCKMEPNKLRVKELTLLYYSVRDLVEIDEVQGPVDDHLVNMGAILSDHLVSLRNKPFKGTSAEKDTMGSLLTLTFRHLEIRLDPYTVV